MFGAIFRFLVQWVPFFGRLFPDIRGSSRQEPQKELPAARVAIIGAGVGGCCAAYFLRELGGQNLDIHVWQKKDSKVGGRTAVIEFDGHLYESGASVIHTSNKYLVELAKKFGLDTKGDKDSGTTPLAIYNGKQFVFRTGTSKIINMIKTIWHYGLTLIRMDFFVRSLLKKFISIYDLQASGKSFSTVSDMLRAMGGQEMYELTQISTEEYLIGQKGWSEKVVHELVVPALRVNYGQNGGVDVFTTGVALAGMEDGSLWSVVGGNRLIPVKALEASGASLHEAEVYSVTRVESEGKVSYVVGAEDTTKGGSGEESSSQFDVVIVANPLNVSSIKFEEFPLPIYTAAATTPYQRTVAEFVKGEINPAFVGLGSYGRDFPQQILSTADLNGSQIDFRSIAVEIPSEIPGSEVKQFEKPIDQDPMRVWKVFVPQPLTQEEKQQIFQEISDEATVDWLAYPVYNPPENTPPFILDNGMFYINGIEKAASAMEMSAIGAKNVALLARDYLSKQQ